jgi:hypothetical protein
MPRLRIIGITLLITLAPALWAGEGKLRRSPNAIKDDYIVVLEDDTPRDRVPEIARSLAESHGGSLGRVWRDALKGFQVQMTEARAKALSHNPHVKYIEQNVELYSSSAVDTKRDPACDRVLPTDCKTADNRLWYLDVLDQNSALAVDSYENCGADGTGVWVYVVDEGVNRAHREFGNDSSRVRVGYNAATDGDYYPASDPCHGFTTMAQDVGHGTGVASVVAGQNLGVARGATIVPVKVANCGDTVKPFLPPARNQEFALGQIVTIQGSESYICTRAGKTGPVWNFTIVPWGDPNQYLEDGTARFHWRGDNVTRKTNAMLIEGLDWILRDIDPNGNPPLFPYNPYPKFPAVVTLSTYAIVGEDGVAESADYPLSIEEAIWNLLKYRNPADPPGVQRGITVIASANNQDANACVTTPARLSRQSPLNFHDATRPYKVITVGGTMIWNNPDPNPLAHGGNPTEIGPEPAYVDSKPTVLRRWRCHAGDSDVCSGNLRGTSPVTRPDPTTDPNGFAGTVLGSNGGQCVTLFAPAKNIPVALTTGPNDYRNARKTTNAGASGTSWSAPMVAGMVARILQNEPNLNIDQVYEKLMMYTKPFCDTTELDPPGVTGTPNKVLQVKNIAVASLPQTTQLATSGNTNITINATGSGPFIYELYRVNNNFNVALYNAHAAASTKVATQTTNVFSVTSTAGVSYFARVIGSCGSADTNITTLGTDAENQTSSISPPSGIMANAINGTVTVSWPAVANVGGYKVERKIGSAAWSSIRTVGATTTWIEDVPLAPSGVALYRVRSTSGASVSFPSSTDVAYVKTFSAVLDASVTFVDAVHLVELRAAVNALRELAGTAPLYAGNDLDATYVRTQFVSATDFTTLMTNLNAARTAPAVGLTSVGFRFAPQSLQWIDDTQMIDLRSAVE